MISIILLIHENRQIRYLDAKHSARENSRMTSTEKISLTDSFESWPMAQHQHEI